MENIDGDEIFNALMRDAKFRAKAQTLREATKPFILAMPDVLAAHLARKVTVLSIFQAKIAVLRYLEKNGYREAIVDLLPPEVLMGLPTVSAIDMLVRLDKEKMATLSNAVMNITMHLNGLGKTESQFMAEILTASELFLRYKAGLLTIEQLLVEQPNIIFEM